jgi:hypothetical protein
LGAPSIEVGRALGINNMQFPTVVAGDDGCASFAFLGTTTAGDDQAATFPGVCTATPKAKGRVRWTP